MRNTAAAIAIVTATATEDVNVFVTAVSKTSVTVEVSKADYNGQVYLIGIERGCCYGSKRSFGRAIPRL